jgi:RND superfamily putative drug exporter
MFAWLGRFAIRRRGVILGASAVTLAVAVAVLVGGGSLSSGDTQGIESDTAQRLVERQLAYPGDSSFMILFRGRELEATDPRFMRALHDALAPLRSDPRVRLVLAPDDAPPPIAARLLSASQHSALAVVTLRDDFPQAAATYPALRDAVHSDVLSASFTGNLAFRYDLDRVLERDLILAELISLPLALLVLLLVFRTVAAAALSVGVGVLAVVTGIAAVTALSRVIDIAVYAVNVASLIGLGVAIDYSLFIVSRYRDELAAGKDYDAALRCAVETAGKAVAFSGLAVGIGLGSLLFFHGSFLATMGLAAAIVVGLAVTFALTFLPAVLSAIGPGIHFGRIAPERRAVVDGAWHRIAMWVMRRPVLVLVSALTVLVALGLPFVRLTMAAADVRTLPRQVEARDTFEALREAFPEQTRTRILGVAVFPSAPALTAERIGALYDLSHRIRNLPDVAAVDSIADIDPGMTRDDYQELAETPEAALPPAARQMLGMVAGKDILLLSVLSDAAPANDRARAIVRALRRDRRVGDGTLLVAGPTAHDVDVTAFILGRAPAAIAFMMVTTYVVLFVLLRSVLLPLKAVVMNLLSITASFGALVWIFQDGHLASWLHFEPAPLDPTLPVLLFCAVFGLSMDYEVLMLARMKEEYERTGNNTRAVASGLERSARLVTSAAAIMVTVFVAFALARVVVVKAMGVGLAIAVALDATLVRVLVVPAAMRLFGDLNWWAPRFLRRQSIPIAPPAAAAFDRHVRVRGMKTFTTEAQRRGEL